ncbi:type II secretion system protein [Massilia sp. UMI-21]|nr:type II secretion system protein [Massilia sp. UMI-21]
MAVPPRHARRNPDRARLILLSNRFRSRPARRARGFTMVELVIVMVLIGILGAIAAGRFFDRGGFDAAAFADQTRALLRYGQKLAIARNSPVYVLLGGQRVALCATQPHGGCPLLGRVVAPGGNVGDPASATRCGDERWYCLGLPDGVQISLSVPMTEFGFDALGRPIATSGSFGGLAMTVTGQGERHSVSVEPETGYVR